MVTFGALGIHFGRSWKVPGFILRSLAVILVPRTSKMDTTNDLADIAKTDENNWFLLVLEGWRLTL